MSAVPLFATWCRCGSSRWILAVVLGDKCFGYIHAVIGTEQQAGLGKFADIQNHRDPTSRGESIQSLSDVFRNRCNRGLVTALVFSLILFLFVFQLALEFFALLLLLLDRRVADTLRVRLQFLEFVGDPLKLLLHVS